MASNTLHCHMCHKAIEDKESSIKHHFSSFHVKYWPYSCSTCYEKGSSHKESTEVAMEEHIATFHGKNNSGYYVPKKTGNDRKKEAKLQAAIAECRRSSTLQITSPNPTNALQQDLNFVHNGTTESENDIEDEQIPDDSKDHLRQIFFSLNPNFTPIESGLVSIEVKNECFDSALLPSANDNDEGRARNEQRDYGIQPRDNELWGQQLCAVNYPGQHNAAAKKPFSEANMPCTNQTHFDVASTSSGTNPRKRKVSLENRKRRPTEPAGPAAGTSVRPDQCSEASQWHPTRPMREYLTALQQSEPDVLGCEAHIVFGRLNFLGEEGDHPENVGRNFEKFSQEIHSIAHLWANGRVVAELDEYSESENKILPVSDFCKGLFSEERSILECKELEIKLDSNSWPFAVITNVARRCNKLILKEIPLKKNQRLHYKFLDALYKMMLPAHIEITLKFYFGESVRELIDELKERFHSQPSAGQHFMFNLLSPCTVYDTKLQSDYCTLVVTEIMPPNRSDTYNVVIAQLPNSQLVLSQNPTTSAQVSLDAPTDPAQKMKTRKTRIGLSSGNASYAISDLAQKLKITKIWIDISNGITNFQTSESIKQPSNPFYGYSLPLCEYLSILCKSEADEAGCDVHIDYHTKSHGNSSQFTRDGHRVMRSESVTATRKKFETFSKQIHSIAHLWANGRVSAELWEYSNHNDKVLPVSVFCDGLFSQERSILKCKELKLTVGNGWPLSVITNVANRCNKIVFEEFEFVDYREQRLHYYFLDAMYEMKLQRYIEVTLKLHFSESGKQFIDELKKRFQLSSGQCFKFRLLTKREIPKKVIQNKQSPQNSGTPNIPNMPDIKLQNSYGTLETKPIVSHSNRYDIVLIQQRSFPSVPDQHLHSF
ncbi:hypothetical protein Ddc_13047 [Ditylenchus destructor]|nr:hypothetical protein Ddc_13047 [Ditylenchus destructor]